MVSTQCLLLWCMISASPYATLSMDQGNTNSQSEEFRLGPTTPEINAKAKRAKELLLHNAEDSAALTEAINLFASILPSVKPEQQRKIQAIIQRIEAKRDSESYDHVSRLELNDDEEAGSPKALEKYTYFARWPEEKEKS